MEGSVKIDISVSNGHIGTSARESHFRGARGTGTISFSGSGRLVLDISSLPDYKGRLLRTRILFSAMDMIFVLKDAGFLAGTEEPKKIVSEESQEEELLADLPAAVIAHKPFVLPEDYVEGPSLSDWLQEMGYL